MDGWITIGTQLSTKQLDKDLKNEETKLKKYAKENEMLINAKVKIEKSNAMKEYNQLKKAIETSFDTKIKFAQQDKYVGYEKAIEKYNQKKNVEIQKLNESYSEQLSKIEEINQKLISNTYQQELIKNKIKEINQEYGKVQNLEQINKYLDDAKNKTENNTKKVAKWALAIFSVRSAYSFIRNSISTISQYNEQIGTDIEYIRYALASLLQPIVERIIQLAYKLLAYINYISQAWFGVNLFANASAKAFDKAKKSIGSANKSAKELQKTLLGFDEMNILQDGSTSVGGGGGGIALPSFDLGNMADIEIPSWIKWIADNKEIILGILEAIGLALVSIKYGMQGIMAIGIGIAIINVINLIKDIITFINDPSWGNFKNILMDLTGVLAGVGLAMVAFNATNPVGWITLAIGVLGTLIGKLGEDEQKTLDLTKAKQNLNNAEKEFVNAQNKYTASIQNREQALKDLQRIEKETKISGEDLYKSVMTGQLRYENMTKQQQETYLAYVKYKGTIADVETATKELQKEEHDLILTSLEEQATVAATKNDFEDFSKTLNNLIDNGTVSVEEAYKIINDVFGKMNGLGKDVLGIQFPKYFSSATNSAEALRRKVQDLYNQYKKLKDLGFPSTSGASYSGNTLFAKGGVLAYAKGGIFNPIKLASGAIINEPGRGVPIGTRAIGGEHGAEGIIPLTDSQQMDLLGSAIGRRVTVNLTNITEMNGRIISRELHKIQNQDDFAFNG